MSGVDVQLLINGTSVGIATTDGVGAYTINTSINAGDNLLAYIDGNATDGNTVTVSSNGSITGLDIYGGHLNVYNHNTGSTTNANISSAKASNPDNDIIYSVSGNNLTTTNGIELFVQNGHSYTPGGNITAEFVKVRGTFDATGSHTFTINNDWDAGSGGTYTEGNSTVNFVGGDNVFIPGTSSYYNVQKSTGSNNNLLTLGSNLTVSNNLLINNGQLDVSASNYSVTIGGNFTIVNDFIERSGTVTLNGTNQTLTGNITFYNLTKTITNADTLTINAGNTLTIANGLTLSGASGQLLSLRSSTLGTQWNIIVNSGVTKSLDYLDVKDSDNSGSDPSNIPLSPTNSVDSGNTNGWFSAATKTISGTVYSDEGVTPFGNVAVRLVVNGSLINTVTANGSGMYSFTETIGVGDNLLVHIEGAGGGNKGNSITVTGTGNITNLDIYSGDVLPFNHNNSVTSIANINSALGAYTDNDVLFSVTAGALTILSPFELHVPSGQSFTPGGNITADYIKISGSLDATGTHTFNITLDWDASAGTYTQGNSTVNFVGNANTFTPGISSYYNVQKTSGSNNALLTLGSNLTVSNDLSINNGKLDVSASNYSVSIGGNFTIVNDFVERNGTVTLNGTNQTLTGNITFYALSKTVVTADTLTVNAGNTLTVSNSITLTGALGQLLSLRSSTAGTMWSIILNAGAIKSLDYLDVKDSDNSGSDASHKPLNPTNSTDSGNTIAWFGGGSASISGIVYSDEGVTPLGGVDVQLLINGASAGIVTADGSGNYTFNTSISPGDNLLAYIDGHATNGNAVTVAGSSNVTNLDIYGNHVVINNHNTGSTSIANMNSALGAYSDNDIIFSVTAGALTILSPFELHVPSGQSFTPGGNITADYIKILGTFNATGSHTFTINNDWAASVGTYIEGTSTVNFVGGNNIFIPGTSSYFNVQKTSGGNNSLLTLGSNLTVSNDLLINNGQLDVSASNYSLTIGGNFTIANDFVERNGTVTLNGTNQTLTGPLTFYTLTKTVSSVDTLTINAGDTLTISNSITLTGVNGALLSLRSSTPGNQWGLIVNATATTTIEYIDVKDSDNSGSDVSHKPIDPKRSNDSGNNIDWFTANPPIGGYTSNNIIPAAQISQAADGSGVITINWKGRDLETSNVTLKAFEYSVDGGATWNAPINGDNSASLSTNWNNNGGSGYATEKNFGSATVHSFTFDTQHADVSGMAGVDQSDIQIRFTLNDGGLDSTLPATSENFQVDNVAPTSTFTSATYNSASNTMTLTGTNFTTIAAASTDIKTFVDWSKFVWDINGDNGITADITFVVGDVTSLTVTDASTLTLVFTSAKATAIEATTGYDGGDDTLDITAGFSIDAFGNAATSDGLSDGALAVITPVITVLKLSTLVSDPVNGGANPKRIPGAVIEYSIMPSNSGNASPDSNSTIVIDHIDNSTLTFDATTGVSFTDGTTTSGLTMGTVTYSNTAVPGPYVYDYIPVPDGSGYDSNVTSIKITTTGSFAYGGTPMASFTLKYRVKIM